MPNRQLTANELEHARALLTSVRSELERLSGGDPDLLFAYRRKIYKELTYDEREKPSVRRRLKRAKRRAQGGVCPICNEPLPETYTVLDRFNAADGYTDANTRLIHAACDTDAQASRGYT